MIHVSAKHQVVGVPYRADLAGLFPHAKQMDFGGEPHLILPHDVDETRLLRNLGMDVPAPITLQYDWPGVRKPFDVQVKTCALLTTERRAYVLSSMGVGKSSAALWSFDYLRGLGRARKALIVAPLSTLDFTWRREALATTPHLKVAILHGSRERRFARLAEDADIYVVNHDGVALLYDELVRRTDIDVLVIDELAVYRNGTSKRTKTLRDLAKRFAWVWGMTGSPTPRSPTDVWGQACIVTPHNVPKHFNWFRDQLMYKVSQFKFQAKPDAVDKAFEVMQPAVRFSLDDVTELPDMVERTVDVPLGPQQAKAYKALMDQLHVMIGTQAVTAANAGAALQKLLQIGTGWVYTAKRDVVALDNDARLQSLSDAVESTDRKVLVFAPFLNALDGIAEHLTKEGVEHAVVHGGTSQTERSEVFNLFQNTGKFKVLLAHPQCLAHGITLTAADTAIWFAPIADLEIFSQANARIRRVGQKHRQQLIMLQATPVEKRMYRLLQQKAFSQNKLLQLFQEASV